MRTSNADRLGERVGLTFIDRLERGFATTIETIPEFNLRNAARPKIANVSSNGSVVSIISAAVGGVITSPVDGSTRNAITIVPSGAVGVTSAVVVTSPVAVVIAIGVGSVIGASRYEVARVVENGVVCEVSGDAKNGIESVGLDTSLRRGSGRSGSFGVGTSVTSGSISLASVHELVAHKLCDNADVLSRTVGVGFYVESKTKSVSRRTYGEIRRLDELTSVSGTERGLLPAIETLTKFDLGDGTRAKIPNVPSAVGSAIVDVSIVGGGPGNIGSAVTGGGGVWLHPTLDGSPLGRVEEQFGVIRRVLSLKQSIKFAVPWSLLAKDGIPKCRWVRTQVQRGVLLSLTVLDGCSDHLGPSGGIELTRRVCGVV